MNRILLSLAAMFLVLGGVSMAQVGQRNTSFGALDTMNEATAKVKLAAWLKEVGKSDPQTLQKLDTIWNDRERTIIDRMAASFALGDPVAAQLINEARNPLAPAPIILPEVFKNEKLSVFYRANLGLIYARSLTNRRVYEEALATLQRFSPEQVADPAAYLFHRAVCEHALLRKADATKSIKRMFQEAASLAPERYKNVAVLILVDMDTWKDKDLGDIARKMENIERRLDIARGGPETQRQQREVLNRLDELIKKLENQNKSKKKDPKDGPPKDGPPKDGDGPPMPGGQGDQCPDGGGPPGSKPGQGDKEGEPKGIDPPKTGAKDSKQPPTVGGTGQTTKASFKDVESRWDSMSPRQREDALQSLTAGMPARHREAVENYFHNLTATQKK